MRAILVPFLAVSAWSFSGCASRAYFDDPELIPGSYEIGEVVEVELVGPARYRCYRDDYGSPYLDWDIVPYPCSRITGRNGNGPKLSGKRSDAVAARGPDGVVDLESGWTIHTTVRREDGDEIRIISSRDIGLVPGDQVRLGFRDLPPEIWSQNVVLGRPFDEPLDSQAEVTLSSSRAAWILQSTLAYSIAETDVQSLNKAQRDAMQALGGIILRSLEEDFVDSIYGFRSADELLLTIRPIHAEENLHRAVALAWQEYKKRAMPEFSMWIAMHVLSN